MDKYICSLHKNSKIGGHETCCKKHAEKKLLEILRKDIKKPSKKIITKLDEILKHQKININNNKEKEVFSFSEEIDKFIIIALKNQYLTGKKLNQNSKDCEIVLEILRSKFSFHKILSKKKFINLCEKLWVVNAEIFCINDVCAENLDDRIVAAAARRMIEMIKERNKVKREIAEQLGDFFYETKQFK